MVSCLQPKADWRWAVRLMIMAVATSLILPASAGAQFPQTIPSGDVIAVRTSESITPATADGRIFAGVVDSDVRDTNGEIAIPAGSSVELIARQTASDTLVLDL